MKVKCYNCGLVREVNEEALGEGKCPECGFHRWFSLPKREIVEKQMDTLDPFHYRKKCKEEGLAFEIFDIKDGNKIRSRKIYLNGHVEGFKGDPCVINHIAPKILALKDFVEQMNKDYRDFIELHLVRGLPIDQESLHRLYISELERINNIKI